MIGRPPKHPVERFVTRIEVDSNGCWVWQGVRIDGYGQMRGPAPASKSVGVHRFAYEQYVGPVPQGLQLDHLCRNRACCNPDHLEPVTPYENQQRAKPFRVRKTHCPQGHPYSGDNLRVRPTGQYACRACDRIAHRKKKASA